ncbi:vanadium-dependent haloperoxidase [Chondrinema litorale]|uniref:vanadium-dependent haloperoxidase n=1 Tax=Chondrinema litorale TaxID=2994555 RepID=UPI00254291E7|nr:vanadium-dependent haloperoxidase [Chondrinema litorale]UZR92502.1 vanadium-dependent haloperoxidase [Chondrinema litorale]
MKLYPVHTFGFKSARHALKILSAILFFSFTLVSCEKEENQETQTSIDVNDPEIFHRSMKKLTDIIVHDIFSPPVASRIYSYPSIAAYEIMVQENPEFRSLQNQLTDLKDVPQADKNKEYCFPLAAINAFLMTGKTMIFSEDKMESYQQEIYNDFKNSGISQEVYDRSMAYGEQVAKHIIQWSGSDNYKQTRTFPKFTVTEETGRWKPTPPDYMEGIEPHWSKIRPFVIDSCNQFVPARPSAFGLDKNSEFYKEVMEVYETVNNLDDEQHSIAKFWDCNPYVSNHRGHAMFAIKKITPGGHWIGITSIAGKQANLDFMKTVEAYTVVSVSLMDAFISCWDEKYRSNLIRPETVINEYIDEDWLPLLQTPPFPEYTSGHSVISSAAAVALTNLIGDNFSYIDSTETEYGLPPRNYTSFIQASEEAAISRLYGGIHYMPAIKNGVAQGREIGGFIQNNLHTRNNQLAEKSE